MKTNFRIVLFLIGVLLIVCNSFALAHTNVTALQARDLIDSTDDLIVLDVRELSEYCGAKRHIQGALNYPWNSGVLQARYEELPMDVPVLVVCGSGGRSNSAANFLDSKNFSIVYDMLGGMSSWIWETVPCVDPDAKYGGGTGDPNDPYQIATAEDLMLLGEMPEDYDKHFILTADIDLDPNLPGGQVFIHAVVAPDMDPVQWGFQGTFFTGVFDGGGHTISHLTIEGAGYLGLFGKVASSGHVVNLGVVDVSVTGSDDYVGGLAGWNDGLLARCYSTGEVCGGEFVGGLAGFTADPWDHLMMGSGIEMGDGIGMINHCYSTATVSGDRDVGGLAGYNSGAINQCYSTGVVSGSGGVGGLVGSSTSASVTSCFWDVESSGQAESIAGGTGLTTAEMQDMRIYVEAGWDFVDENENGTSQVWQTPQGSGYPVLAIFNSYTPPQLQGLGTQENPYLISNALELGAMIYYSPFAHYQLAASVDLAGISWGTAVVPWYAGTFNGNGQTISHVTVDGGEYIGLFGKLASAGRVRRLGVLDVNMTGSDHYVGGLAGWNEGELVECYITGTVQVAGGYDSSYVGGLAGINLGIVNCCYSSSAANGGYLVGGLVGGNSDGTIIHCYSTGQVSSEGESVGGLVGYGNNAVSSFWDIQTSGLSTSAAGKGRTTEQMKQVSNYQGWNNCSQAVWTIDEGKDYPHLTWEGREGAAIASSSLVDFLSGNGTKAAPYLIESAEEFNLIGLYPCEWDKYFLLASDIDLSACQKNEYNLIGVSSSMSFAGVFDGNGHTVFGFTYISPTCDCIGLYGYTDTNGLIRNLGVQDVNVSGRTCVGALVGYNMGTVADCYSTGSTGGYRYVGGIAGVNEGVMSGCNSSGAVSVGDCIGGLVGGNVGSVNQCFSTAIVNGYSDIGGLVGINAGALTGCYSTGDISGTGYETGGLVGWNYGVVTQCCSTGTVDGQWGVGGLVGINDGGKVADCYSISETVSGESYVGGLVGYNSFGAITRSYSTGEIISSGEYVGGLVGGNVEGNVENSFWDIETSGLTISAGGEGKTTTEMQMKRTFTDVGWDFVDETENGTDDIWWILEGRDYPRLWWELSD